MFNADQPLHDAVAAMRERASALIAENRHDEAEAILDEIAKTITDYETRTRSPAPS
jgi:hypothetical protein